MATTYSQREDNLKIHQYLKKHIGLCDSRIGREIISEAQEREHSHRSPFIKSLLNVLYWEVFRLSRGYGASPEEAYTLFRLQEILLRLYSP